MSDIGEAILTGISEIKGTVQALDSRFTGLDRDIATLKTDLTAVKVDLVALRADVAPMRAHLDGMPMLARNLTVTQQEVRGLKAARGSKSCCCRISISPSRRAPESMTGLCAGANVLASNRPT